jgi:hypothetical protein
MADVPDGASGMLCRDCKGKKADRLVTRIDPGVVSLVAELRVHGRRAAQELERWKTHHEVRKVIDAGGPIGRSAPPSGWTRPRSSRSSIG